MHCLPIRGSDREAAIEQASRQLIAAYKKTWPTIVPIELHRLAATLNAKISKVPNLEGGARLVPSRGGFMVLVNPDLPAARQRMAIAHELAHTLFYELMGSIPIRKQQHSEEEEYFCFDVGRRLLAPDWMLDRLGITKCTTAQDAFEGLVSKLKLSKPVAAQVMLRDYLLFKGIAAYWSQRKGKWSVITSKLWASPKLRDSDVKGLKGLCRAWLTDSATFTGGCRVWSYPESDGSTFVAATLVDS